MTSISIVTPSLNQGRYIREAIESVQSQGIPDLEQIVIDGESDDDTLQQLERVSDSVRWSSAPDQGLADAINKGIRLTSGDVIGWLHADDRYTSGALQAVQQCFDESPSIDVVYGHGATIDENGEWTSEIKVVDWHLRSRWRRRLLCQPAVFVRRSTLDRVGMLDNQLRYRPEVDLWLRLLHTGANFRRLDRCLASVRYHDGNRLAGSSHPFRRAEAQLDIIKTLGRYDRRIATRWLLIYGRLIAEGLGYSRKRKVFDRCVLSHARDALQQAMTGAFKRDLEEQSAESLEPYRRLRSAADSTQSRDREQRRAQAGILLKHCLQELESIVKRPRNLGRFMPMSQRAIFEEKLFRLHNYPPRALKVPTFYVSQATQEELPTFSIVTPNMNQGDYIAETIESVTNQNYPNLEYTVQDGNSTDHSVDVIRRYESELSSWRSEPDSGQTQAINRGFSRTSGDVMAYLNSDDLLLPGCLHYVADFFNKHPNVDVVYGHRVLVDEDSREIGRWVLPRHDNKVIMYADYIPQETMFWRKGAWEAVGERLDESFRFAMDWDLLLRFRQAGLRFHRVPRFLGAFRVTADQKTSSQLATLGEQEMKRLRTRELGRKPSYREINRAVRPYIRRHWFYDKLYTMGVFNY